VGAFVDAPEQVGRVAQVVERDLEEGFFAREPSVNRFSDRGVVGGRAQKRLVEDGRVRGEAGDSEVIDVALQRSARERSRVMLSSHRL
jgi:hypothetical protein